MLGDGERGGLWGADPAMRNQASSPSSTGGGRAVPIEMPRLSTEEGTATLSAWLVAVGDAVEKGAIVAELETDKATVELEAPVEGRIESLAVAAGTEGLKPGILLGTIAPTAAVVAPSASREAPASKPAVSPTASPAAAPANPAAAPVVSKLDASVRSPATPLARRVAEVQGVDLERVKGTGLAGRIEKADVERSASPTTAAAPIELATEKASTAARESLARAPRAPAHLSLRCRMEAILAARARLNGKPGAGSGEAHITLNDFIVRAAALALRDVPAANLRRTGGSLEGVESAEAIDVAVVAATDAGPVTLVLRDADCKGLAVLSQETRSQVERARSGGPPEASDPSGTIAITSFARFGIESAHPMLPREQICLLGVGTVIEEPVVKDGAVAIGSTLSLTLAFDPSAVGGAVAAQLLGAIRGHLEDPLSMML